MGLKVFDICSGIGGFSLGLEATGEFKTIAFCEFDKFCQRVLNKHWPEIPIYQDLKEVSKNEETIRNIPEHDVICGGIPCQPFSTAGKQEGKKDDRHLWPYMFKIIKQKKPSYVIVENVSGFVNVALDDVCFDLESEGYATQSFIIPACGVEAPHKRDRVWIIGKRQNVFNTNSERKSDGFRGVQKKNGKISKWNDNAKFDNTSERRNKTTNENVADSSSSRQQRSWEFGKWSCAKTYGKRQTNNAFSIGVADQWSVEPRVGRVANGIPNRVDRLKALGNAVVPQIVFRIGLAILEDYYGQ